MVLPYLELGLRQGQLLLLLDGRVGRSDDYYTETSIRSKASGAYGERGYTYTYRAWYLGAVVGFSLVRHE